MGLSLWMLSTVARCVTPTACPSDAELLAAAWRWDLARAGDQVAAAEARGEIILVHPRPPQQVERVLCGDWVGGADGPVIVCAMAVRYFDGVSYRTATLRKQADGWTMLDVLGLWRGGRMEK